MPRSEGTVVAFDRRPSRSRPRDDARRRFLESAVRSVLGGEFELRRRCEACGSSAHGAHEALCAGQPVARISASHSAGWSVYLVATGGKAAIDVELREDLFDIAALASRILSAEEHRASKAIPADRFSRWLYQVWVTKEAILKADGIGLYAEPRTLTVCGRDGSLAGVVEWRHVTYACRSVELHPDVTAVAAFEHPPADLPARIVRAP